MWKELTTIPLTDIDPGAMSLGQKLFYFWIQTLRVWEAEGAKQVSNEVSFNCFLGTKSSLFILDFLGFPLASEDFDWFLIMSH